MGILQRRICSKSGAMPVYELKRLFGIPYEQYYNQFNFDVTTYQVVRHGNKSWLRLKEDYDNQWDIAPEHVYSMLLSYLFRRASDLYNGVIKGVVITVPANFTPIQIHETVLSAKMAGLNVLRIIYEPNAAALAYRRQNERLRIRCLCVTWEAARRYHANEVCGQFIFNRAHFRQLPLGWLRFRSCPWPSCFATKRAI